MLTHKKLSTIVVAALLLLAIVVAGCTPAARAGTVETTAAAQPVGSLPVGSVTVIGRGEAYGTPDRANVQIGVETFAETVEEATNQNEATTQAVLAALREAGVDEKDLQTSNYSLWAEQIYGDRGPEGIAGYRVSNQVSVTIRNIENLDTVLEAAMAAGANNIYGVNFSVADTAALEAEARAAAIADAKARAESMAELGGVELGAIQIMSEVTGQPIMFPQGGGGGYAMEQAAAPSISPGQLSYQVQVQVTYALD